MESLHVLRLHLSRPDALLQLALLGLMAGLLTGAVIVAFRLLVEGTQDAFLPGEGAENYEALPAWLRFTLPVIGGLLLAALFRWVANGYYVLGVAKVMERMAYYQGHLAMRGFITQFLGAAIAITSGHSVGREGPHVYLGAAASSLMGQYLSLPNNSVRTLVGCGTAAGIAASFNTPLAGVVFALEVVMLEYSVASFIPVILAAASATALSVFVFGPEPAFAMPEVPAFSLVEIPLVLFLGLLVGTLAALYVHLLQQIALHARPMAIWWRNILAGVIVGVCALLVPQVMGIGYDTVNLALLGEFGLWALVILLAGKLIATSACVGLGVPGGMIGPSLFLGATIGSFVGILAQQLWPDLGVSVAFYTLLGMGAMMGASLQAPLAALTAIVELTHSPGIVMPGMLVVVVSGLVASELFRKESIFVTTLKSNGMDYNANPVLQMLRRIGVGSVMARQFVRVDAEVSVALVDRLIANDTDWVLIERDGVPDQLMPVVDLAKYRLLQEDEETAEIIDLMEIPATRYQLGSIPLQANLQEALELLEQGPAEALYVHAHRRDRDEGIYGVLTREMVESSYRF